MTTPSQIKTVEDLHEYLILGMKIEHATLPPYLTTLYSLIPGSNLEAFHAIRSVAVEEMLHLTLAANVFNAVGGEIKGILTKDDFVPSYPTYLPTGAKDFCVNLGRFSHETIETFLNIERSKDVAEDEPLVKPRSNPSSWFPFYSIGLFYAEVIRGLKALYQEMGDALFCGNSNKQITPEYYYNGAGDVIPVKDYDSAIRALTVIQEQGEGSRTGAIYDAERELCHYYRFQQLELGQYYVVDKHNPLASDEPDHPTGETFTVDWDAVYPILENAQLKDYPEGSEVHAQAQQFQEAYSQFLAQIEFAFNGHPDKLLPAVGGMFRLKELANNLVRNPIPGRNDGAHAAPIYRPDQEPDCKL